MSGWSRFDAATVALSRVPERWAFRRLRPPDPLRPTRAQVVDGFIAVHAVSSVLGPTETNELTPDEGYGPGGVWPRFNDRWPDLRTLRGPDVRTWLASDETPPIASDELQAVQGWLRDRIGMVAQTILGDVPAAYNDDPEDLREAAFAGLLRVAPLLSDTRQSGCFRTVVQQVEMRAYEFARHLYHLPNAGPGIREAIHDVFDAEHAAQLVADPPGPDEAPPWS